MSAKWLYQDEDGNRLAELSLDAAPPLGWPVAMVGPDIGPVRHYVVTAIDPERQVLVLRRSFETLSH